MKNRKTLYLTILYLLLSNLALQAQVTIGIVEPPQKGTLLEIKNIAGVTNGDANATKGIGMPRIELTNLNPTTPSELAQSIGNSTGNWDMLEHVGLLVYNTKEDLCATYPIVKGLYVWDGGNWHPLNKEVNPSVYSVTDVRDGELYLARKFGNVAGDWMLENMRYVPKVDNGYTDYFHTAAISTTAKNYAYAEGNETPYVPNNHPSATWESKKRNGLLYNWLAATNRENSSTSDQGQTVSGADPIITPIQGICPPNWHIPSDKEWNDLEREIYNNAHLYSTYTETEKNSWPTWQTAWETTGGTTAAYRPSSVSAAHGIAIKSPCTIGNGFPSDGKSLYPDLSGFNGLLVGFGNNGGVGSTGILSFLWSSSSTNGTRAWQRILYLGTAGVGKAAAERTGLFSVRCKKD